MWRSLHVVMVLHIIRLSQCHRYTDSDRERRTSLPYLRPMVPGFGPACPHLLLAAANSTHTSVLGHPACDDPSSVRCALFAADVLRYLCSFDPVISRDFAVRYSIQSEHTDHEAVITTSAPVVSLSPARLPCQPHQAVRANHLLIRAIEE